MSEKTQYTASHIPAAGLWEAAMDVFYREFRGDLEDTPYADIRPTHGCVFRFIRADEGMRLTRLAHLAGMTKQSVGEIVDDLASRGYLERIPDPDDRRAKLITLTPKGVEAQQTGFSLISALEQRWADRYGAERWADMRSLLEDLVATEAPDLAPELAQAHATEPVAA